jgi:hypothetical protein
LIFNKSAIGNAKGSLVKRPKSLSILVINATKVTALALVMDRDSGFVSILVRRLVLNLMFRLVRDHLVTGDVSKSGDHLAYCHRGLQDCLLKKLSRWTISTNAL